MNHLFSILVTLVPIVVVAGIVFALFKAYKRLSRLYFALLLFPLIAIPYAAFKHWESNFKLSFVPDALNVTSISYTKEESWGFGPGGNEAGIRVYPLPEHVSNKISQHGIEFFNKLPENHNQKNREWRGFYRNWKDDPWELNEKTNKLDIYSYICTYGFGIVIDKEVAKVATEIINNPGSYYAYGRRGLIVVSPNKKLVLYMYNG